MDQKEELARGIEALGVTLSQEQQKKLLDFLALLYKWNSAYNLTAIRDQEQAVALQLLDSLAILPLLPEGPILDIGSGGGMPGIPLAIARPETQITLLDSNSKKTRFLTQAKLELGLDNMSVMHSRIEAWQPQTMPVAITSRAFAELECMLDWTYHLLEKGAQLFAMKGINPQQEIDALKGMPLEIEVTPLQVPGIDAHRHLVRIALERQ
ncbi:16S rRNA (guanine(527)-N(7))-methyltransferase RsmG [Solemya velum gill symbiont]|uniref:16S rRNA (guanine(527)-N(7))-methyltransferase RsmG n=1 Tax=Solemya velum gill symbiont TaxID=2340 RepID=UPI000996B461|nr:16S rRNA (guanine(527)-N(7))-methyltransferase RsmG [Solemya velum gill symbiont]OOY52681.1 16S rRNA (guanine(527)-N(7))-methyltransferase RsmG [Solemya velum gill symbiont]OOY65798.1 16S rRNA (guanine(527)-N(7))-methyltransferase RsmG [Solemya velum gill symbiont]OOY67806.1 16S rRNA (guanine(527)-N(7))-methyltransferase RsmG [Solemya velum gill symbiont]OOY70291.1 16S rRNA (guanine(527)-N(7))-methyltransferase RsmG [Solemya velum gill symbiont]OOY80004.1 16S rRNA (guanine(527)-N(7))-methyl